DEDSWKEFQDFGEWRADGASRSGPDRSGDAVFRDAGLVQLQAEPGRVGDGYAAVDGLDRLADMGAGGGALLDAEREGGGGVGDGGGEGGGGGGGGGGGEAGVDHGHAGVGGQDGDLHRLGEPAAAGQVDLDDVDVADVHELHERLALALLLAGGDPQRAGGG